MSNVRLFLRERRIEHHREPNTRLVEPPAHDRQVRFHVGIAQLLARLQPRTGFWHLVGPPCGQKAFSGPILDRALHRLLAGLWRVQGGQLVEPVVFSANPRAAGSFRLESRS
jgi:hypothetical protein